MDGQDTTSTQVCNCCGCQEMINVYELDIEKGQFTPLRAEWEACSKISNNKIWLTAQPQQFGNSSQKTRIEQKESGRRRRRRRKVHIWGCENFVALRRAAVKKSLITVDDVNCTSKSFLLTNNSRSYFWSSNLQQRSWYAFRADLILSSCVGK